MGCAPQPIRDVATISVLSGPDRPVPLFGRVRPPAYHGKFKTFAFVCLDSVETAPIAMAGLGKAAEDDAKKPAATAEPQKKVAPFHRVQCLGGHVEIVQAWSKSESRALVKKRGYTLARVTPEPVHSKRAA